MNNVFGVFYMSFSNEGYKGEFFNNHLDRFLPEIITIIQSTRRFVGSFRTEWRESDKLHTSDLTITFQNNVYALVWNNVRIEGEPQPVIFNGRGVLEADKLVCIYTMS